MLQWPCPLCMKNKGVFGSDEDYTLTISVQYNSMVVLSRLPYAHTSSLFIALAVVTAAGIASMAFIAYGFGFSIPKNLVVFVNSAGNCSSPSTRNLSSQSQVHVTKLGVTINATRHQTDAEDSVTLSSDKQHLPTILLWQRPFGHKHYGPREDVHCGCRYTYDRSHALISDAVVIYCHDADSKKLPPDFPNRNVSQLYIWWCLEPPTHVFNYQLGMEDYRSGFFNWTMTYRRDSNVSTPWDTAASVKSTLRKSNMSLESILKMKNRTAIAIVGNCGSIRGPSARQRLKFIKQLQRVMPIDCYGHCFKHKISNQDFSKIVQSYKFYFSYENSYHCKDYISEKFWLKSLRNGVVPVVWGASADDYAAVAPNLSYILAEAFNSTEALVKYLRYLDSNDTAYLEFLQWRSPQNLNKERSEEVQPPLSSDFMNLCVLCRRLQQRQQQGDETTSMVGSVQEYFLDSNDDACLHGPRKNEAWGYHL